MESPASASAASISVAAVQMNSRGDKAQNIATALRLIDEAAASGARLVALPEVWTYLDRDEGNRTHAEPIPGPTIDLLADRARALGIYLHCGSIHELREGDPRVFNTSVVLGPAGDILATYSKIHMFDVVLDGVATYQESATVSAGDEIVVVEMDGLKAGLAICYDLRFPELFRILALQGAELVVLPSAFTMTTGKDHWEVLIRARAIENGIYLLAPAQVGPHGDGHWCYGRSMIVDPWGTVLATAPDQGTTISSKIERDQVQRARRQVPSLANRKPDLYRWPDSIVATR